MAAPGAGGGWRAAPALLDSPLPPAIVPTTTEASPGVDTSAQLPLRPGRRLLARGRLGAPEGASPLTFRPSMGPKVLPLEKTQEDAPAADPAMDGILRSLETFQLNSPALLQRRRLATPTTAASSSAETSTSSTPASAEVPEPGDAMVEADDDEAEIKAEEDDTKVGPVDDEAKADESPALACPPSPGASPAPSHRSSTSDMLLCDSIMSLPAQDLSTLQPRDVLSSSSLGLSPFDLLEDGGLEAEAWLERRRASTAGGRRGGLVAQLGFFSRNSPVEPSPLARPPAPLPDLPSPTLSPRLAGIDAEVGVKASSVAKPMLLTQDFATPPAKPSTLAKPASARRAHGGVPFTGKPTPRQGSSGPVPTTAPSRIAVPRVLKALHTKGQGSSPLGTARMAREAAPSPTSSTSSPTTPRRHKLLPQKVSGILDTSADPDSKATLESPLKPVTFTSAHRATPPAKARALSRLPVAASRTSGAM